MRTDQYTHKQRETETERAREGGRDRETETERAREGGRAEGREGETNTHTHTHTQHHFRSHPLSQVTFPPLRPPGIPPPALSTATLRCVQARD
eukprot:118698-Rhodomonas_salina.1